MTGLLAPESDVNPTPYASPLHPANIFNVEGLVAVITGGGTGIGLMMATALENNGATVYIVGRRLEILRKAARENSRFGKIIPLEGDITDRASLLTIAETIKAEQGYIDLLVNNAGIARNLFPHPVLWDCGSPEDFAETFAINTTAVYYTTVAFLDLLHQGNLRRQRLACQTTVPNLARPPYHTSQVLSVSSSGSFRIDSKVLSPSYTLSKSACTHLGKLLANLLAPWGIRSNVLAPGVWPSEMTTSPTPTFKLDPFALAEAVPLKRTGSQEDMAGTILFLASRAGAYVNGAVWLVDGGRVGCVASNY
ncbi:uncharacterized protein LACBIDRAFT_188193 [Laccaria bicolor S238N-H82]|uniref:Predicted protein n=1 Tax=Laccaria bicolor (strain S238N-H82 / ATCC MYA-4686) TaxID=486041 RepID=B0CUZ1_LACBS|nr:uncharacterized protein LACBIDRAFT_188193 [Laccaria bicolor S238N-H82]EDR13652.1 predicted protein [Laccaria bicolor S238N-H82]|eukprot:XP_001876150.1 predicted protein [Laccaria bicolor S238N-H82]